MKRSWMRKKTDRSGKKRSGGQKRKTPPLFTLPSLSRKETHFLARSRGRAYSLGRQLRHRHLCSSSTSSLALEAVHIRRAGSCAIVVCAAAASSRQLAGSLSDILVGIIFWGVLSALYNKHNSCSKVLARCNVVVGC
jgi:hypothetical protein